MEENWDYKGKTKIMLELIDYRKHPFNISLFIYILVIVSFVLSKQWGIPFYMETGGFILILFSRADYFKLASFINSYRHYGDDWDDPNINSIEARHDDYLLLITGADKYLNNKNMK